jgi:hypothetical protein
MSSFKLLELPSSCKLSQLIIIFYVLQTYVISQLTIYLLCISKGHKDWYCITIHSWTNSGQQNGYNNKEFVLFWNWPLVEECALVKQSVKVETMTTITRKHIRLAILILYVVQLETHSDLTFESRQARYIVSNKVQDQHQAHKCLTVITDLICLQ